MRNLKWQKRARRRFSPATGLDLITWALRGTVCKMVGLVACSSGWSTACNGGGDRVVVRRGCSSSPVHEIGQVKCQELDLSVEKAGVGSVEVDETVEVVCGRRTAEGKKRILANCLHDKGCGDQGRFARMVTTFQRGDGSMRSH